jgi:hypothetical protein
MNEHYVLSMERGKLNSTSVPRPITMIAGIDRLCWHSGCIHSADSRFNYVVFHHFIEETVILSYKFSKWLPYIV